VSLTVLDLLYSLSGMSNF